MVIRHNLSALNAYRYMNMNFAKMMKSLEKLASGYAINRAGDNPAGLAVSEKMRSQIAGLNQASENAQDGISMIQTYEGALNETESILQRMKTLATQASNGTYDNAVDRASIQLEYEELCKELNDIAATDYNGIAMLTNGRPLKDVYKDVSSDEAEKINEASLDRIQTTTGIALQLGARAKDLKYFDFSYGDVFDRVSAAGERGAKEKSIGGLTADLDCTSFGLGLTDGAGGYDVALTSQASANAAIDQIDFAINKVSMARASFGAVHNRLEHKIDSLNYTAQNLTEAESRIRDADYAAEMMNFTKYQILSQVSQALLAQAVQFPQNILSLLWR